MGAGHLIGGGVRHIDPLIQVLQIGQVHGEQALDDPGIDIGQGTQLGDDPGEQDDGKIAGVLLHLGEMCIRDRPLTLMLGAPLAE